QSLLGQMAGGVSHDLNNLLTVILGHTDLLHEGMSPEELLSHKQAIRKAAQQGCAISGQLLTFSRKQTPTPKVLDLNTVVAELQNMLRRCLGEQIPLLLHLAPDLGHIKADRTHLEQVLLNLAINARDAMPQGGSLTITTTNVYRDADAVRAFPEAQPGPYVCLAVQDTGCGMSPEIKAHIFEPYFTTKEKGKGTGMGL